MNIKVISIYFQGLEKMLLLRKDEPSQTVLVVDRDSSSFQNETPTRNWGRDKERGERNRREEMASKDHLRASRATPTATEVVDHTLIRQSKEGERRRKERREREKDKEGKGEGETAFRGYRRPCGGDRPLFDRNRDFSPYFLFILVYQVKLATKLPNFQLVFFF